MLRRLFFLGWQNEADTQTYQAHGLYWPRGWLIWFAEWIHLAEPLLILACSQERLLEHFRGVANVRESPASESKLPFPRCTLWWSQRPILPVKKRIHTNFILADDLREWRCSKHNLSALNTSKFNSVCFHLRNLWQHLLHFLVLWRFVFHVHQLHPW